MIGRLPTRRNVLTARKRIRSRVHHTPLLTSQSLNELAGVEILFKAEGLQRSGSFKFRGALNAVLSLPAAQRRRGVVTHSSGNHGGALACVASMLGIPATVVVPRGGSAFKRASVERYGGRIVNCGATLAARENKLAEVQRATGAAYVPPYDHNAVIAGQGTAMLEIADDTNADEVWVPVGGGGLASGCVLAAPAEVQIVGAEPALAADARLSLETGVRQPPMPPRTVADGLRTALGERNFSILAAYGLPIRCVSEREITAAQQLAMSCLKVLVETSSAVPLAALMKHGVQNPDTRRVVVVLTGANLQV